MPLSTLNIYWILSFILAVNQVTIPAQWVCSRNVTDLEGVFSAEVKTLSNWICVSKMKWQREDRNTTFQGTEGFLFLLCHIVNKRKRSSSLSRASVLLWKLLEVTNQHWGEWSESGRPGLLAVKRKCEQSGHCKQQINQSPSSQPAAALCTPHTLHSKFPSPVLTGQLTSLFLVTMLGSVPRWIVIAHNLR